MSRSAAVRSTAESLTGRDFGHGLVEEIRFDAGVGPQADVEADLEVQADDLDETTMLLLGDGGPLPFTATGTVLVLDVTKRGVVVADPHLNERGGRGDAQTLHPPPILPLVQP